jgi:RNase P protein component
LRALFLEISDILIEGRYIFVAKPSIAEAQFSQIRDNFKKLTTQYIFKGI